MIVTAPVLVCGIAGAGAEIPIAHILVLGSLMGVLSNVIPYGLDQGILRRVGRSHFAVLLALLPLSATAIGALVMHQIPSTPELLGILAIVVAVAVRRDSPPSVTGTARFSPSAHSSAQPRRTVMVSWPYGQLSRSTNISTG